MITSFPLTFQRPFFVAVGEQWVINCFYTIKTKLLGRQIILLRDKRILSNIINFLLLLLEKMIYFFILVWKPFLIIKTEKFFLFYYFLSKKKHSNKHVRKYIRWKKQQNKNYSIKEKFELWKKTNTVSYIEFVDSRDCACSIWL